MFGDFYYNNRMISRAEFGTLSNGTPVVRVDKNYTPYVQFGIVDNGYIIFQLFQADLFAYSWIRMPIRDFMIHQDAMLFEYLPSITGYDTKEAHTRAISLLNYPAQKGLPSVFGDDFVFWCLVEKDYWNYFSKSKVGNHYKGKYKEWKIFNLYHHAIAIEQDVLIHYTDNNRSKNTLTHICATPFSDLRNPILVQYKNDSFEARWNTRNRALFMLAYQKNFRPYDICQNNCEHFATFCRTGKPSSEQVRSGYLDLFTVGFSFLIPEVAPLAVMRLKKYFI